LPVNHKHLTQEFLGRAKVETTMIYTHVIKDMHSPMASPLDVPGWQRVFGRFLQDAEMCEWSGVQPIFFIWFQHTAKASCCQALLDDATRKAQKSPCTHGLLYSLD
jgi:hypothetical protein